MESRSQDIVRELAFMKNHEPSVQAALRIMQSFCLVGGIQLRYGGTSPATPRFNEHLGRHYLPFCREAIESFLTVGFAPYRLRTLANGSRIPEILPLGTYTWYVSKGMNFGEKKVASQVLLEYKISSMYCDDPIHIHVFTPPQAFFLCSSAFASLLSCYDRLLNKRVCAYRADQFNSQPGVVMERHSRTRMNDLSEKGTVMTYSETRGEETGSAEQRFREMTDMHELMEQNAKRTKLPEDTVSIMAPTNVAVHGLDRVLSPQDMLREELAFTRQVALSCGVPCAMLLAGGGSIGASATSASNTNGWAEGIEGSNRLFLDTCRNMNHHLEALLLEVYKGIYGVNPARAPVFKLPLVPTIPFEQLMIAHEAQLVDDASFSRMLEATWGVGLGKEAQAVRSQKQKAEFVLPFREKPT